MSPPDWVPDVLEDVASAAGNTLEAGYATASGAAGDVRDGAVELAEDAYEQGERLVQEAGRAVEAGVDAAVAGARSVGGALLDTAIARWGPRLQGAGIALDTIASGVDRLVGFATQERLPLDVPAWMVRGAGPLPDVADDLRTAATALGELESALTSLLADTAGRLGWQGDAADAAMARQARQGTQLDQTAEALRAAADAVDDLAGRLRADGPPLEDLLDRYEQLRREALLEAALPTPLLLTARTLDQGPGAAEQARRLAEEVPPIEGRLRDADASARDALATAVATLRRVGAEAGQDGWIGGATSPSVLGVLSRYDVVEDRTDRALVDWAATLGDSAAAAAALRARLSALTPAQLADLLVRHPGMARWLQGGLPEHPAPGSPEALLADAMATATGYSDRSAAVAAALAAMDPAVRKRLALLYPEVVGRLDGAPMEDRVAANRVQISAALLAEQERTADLARALRDRGDAQEGLDELLDEASIALEDDDAAAALQRNAERIAYYELLLHEEVAPGARRPDGPAEVSHQIIYFDPSGDGTIAEVWGPIDEKTRNVGIFVSRTTADMESFAGYSEKAQLLAREDPEGHTTVIAWLGSDMPDAVIANAPNSHYSEAAGERLRDFADGLRLDTDVDVTAVGHSYGGAVVGVADRMGLPADRVVHVESAGAGARVEDIGDYAPGRDVDRYTMQAPGDSISLSQGQHLGSVGHGADVNEMEGVTRLETGRHKDDDNPSTAPGEMVTGHSDPLDPGTTSWNNIGGVIRGDLVTPYAPPTTDTVHPYENPTYTGPDKIDVEP